MSQNAPDPGEDDPLGLHGVVAPTVTAFHEDESVDYEGTAGHARFVVERGVQAVFPLGTVGEFASLTSDERDRAVEAVVDEVAGDVPVVAGVGAESTHKTVQHAVHAAEVGADGLVVVTPYYHRPGRAALVEHYRRVSDAVDLPVYVSHAPAKTGNELSPSTVTRLAAIKNVAGLIDASGDVALLGRAIDDNPELTFLVGSDPLLVSGLDSGCSGVVSPVASAFPELVRDLYAAYDAGDESDARARQSDVYGVCEALERDPGVAGVKAALERRGFQPGPLRSPLQQADPESEAQLERSLATLDLL